MSILTSEPRGLTYESINQNIWWQLFILRH